MKARPKASARPAGAKPDVYASAGSTALLRNTMINVGGQLVPLVVAVVAIPILIGGLGTERFGVLALVWVAIGYFGFLDLGLSRALTQMVASRVAAGRKREVAGLVRTGVLLMAALAIAGTVLLLLTADFLARSVLTVPEELRAETVGALRVLALSLPAVVASAGYRGALEAFQRFGLVNAIKVPGAAVGFLGPVAVLPFSNHLVPVVGVLVLSRIGVLTAYLAAYRHHAPEGPAAFIPGFVKPLFVFGGWMTVSNVVSPLMVYVDRFFIGAFLSLAAVAYYVTPHEVVMKLIVIPAAISAVFFPAFAATTGRSGAAGSLVSLGVKTVVAALFPIVLVTMTFAQEGLALWVGSEFAREGATVLRVLAVGVLINAVGQIMFAFVQGRGRADLTAKLHLIELPVYIAMILFLLPRWGIEGAALAWTLRVTFDTVLLWIVATRLTPLHAPGLPSVWMVGFAASALLIGAALAGGPSLKAAFVLGAMVAFAFLFWKRVLNEEDRAWLAGLKRRIVTSNDR